MADIRVPDYPTYVDSSLTNTARPVTSSQFVAFADMANWLNFNAKRVVPYSRILSGESWEGYSADAMQIPFSLDAPSDVTRYVIVYIGALINRTAETETGLLEVDVTLGNDTVSNSTTITLTSDGLTIGATTDMQRQASNKFIADGYAVLSVDYAGHYLVDVEISGGIGELDGMAIWELPPGVIVKSARGGYAFNEGKIADTRVGALEPNDYWPTENITESGIDNLISSVGQAYDANKRVAFISGPRCFDASNQSNMHFSSRMRLITPNVEAIVSDGGIYIPPMQPVRYNTDFEENEYRSVLLYCFLAVRNEGTGSTDIRLGSEELSTTSSTITVTAGSNGWYSLSSGPHADYSTLPYNCTPINLAVDPEGDWVNIYMDGNNTTYIDSVAMWFAGQTY